MPTCSDCDALISYLHTKHPPKSHTHKNVIEVLRTAPDCDLCNLIISAEFKFQDHDEPATFSLSLYNSEKAISRLEKSQDVLGMFPPMEVSALEDICARTSEIVLEFRFIFDRLVRIYLAVWKDTPCADVAAACDRHREDFFSDHMMDTNPADNRWRQYCPCSTSDIAYRPYGMVTEDESETTLDYIESWLNVCEWACDHGTCGRTRAGELIDGCYPIESDAPLPRRVLDVDADIIKLIETKPGDTGYYFALSHCWGRPENHPPKTTRANIESLSTGIPLSTLPKTFRDAVKIARRMGVQYLWIDSLCIIQDDEVDWKREAANMGAIYEYARLTIAAAGARDCTEGCFVTRRPDLKRVTEIQRHNNIRADKIKEHEESQRTSPPDPPQVTVLSKGNNDLPVTIHLAAIPWELYEPFYSPLGHRAWARQEWYLSRRMLLFTHGGISWKCRSIEFNERERYYDMQEKEDWGHLLERYSNDILTFETDRLYAMQGVATQMAPIMSGTYHFGLWTHMPELLFWMMKGPQWNVEGPDAPSWSWASRSGPKFFWSTIVQFWLGPQQVNLAEDSIQVDEAGILTTTVPVHEASTARVSDEWIAAGHIPWKCNMVPESALLYYARSTNRPVLFLFAPGSPGSRAIGLACLDEDSELGTEKVFCMYILLTCRPADLDDLLLHIPHGGDWEPGDPQFMVKEHNGSSVLPDMLPRSISSGDGPSRDFTMHQHAHILGMDGDVTLNPPEKELYWVLLAQEVTGKPGHYRRIGMGLVSASPVHSSAKIQEVKIV